MRVYDIFSPDCICSRGPVSYTHLYPKADEKEIEFVFDYEKELEACTIMQDKRWLGEAVINVLDNAIKYSPCGSKIFIRLQKRNDFVRMEIEDQGIGIPQNEYHKIFNDFTEEVPRRSWKRAVSYTHLDRHSTTF